MRQAITTISIILLAVSLIITTNRASELEERIHTLEQWVKLAGGL